MAAEVFKYTFLATVPIPDVESTLLIATWACEGLHGAAETRLNTGHWFDERRRELLIDGSTTVGSDLNKMFLGILQREFDCELFQVERVAKTVHPPRPAVTEGIQHAGHT